MSIYENAVKEQEIMKYSRENKRKEAVLEV